jgi:hypothetical protein
MTLDDLGRTHLVPGLFKFFIDFCLPITQVLSRIFALNLDRRNLFRCHDFHCNTFRRTVRLLASRTVRSIVMVCGSAIDDAPTEIQSWIDRESPTPQIDDHDPGGRYDATTLNLVEAYRKGRSSTPKWHRSPD